MQLLSDATCQEIGSILTEIGSLILGYRPKERPPSSGRFLPVEDTKAQGWVPTKLPSLNRIDYNIKKLRQILVSPPGDKHLPTVPAINPISAAQHCNGSLLPGSPGNCEVVKPYSFFFSRQLKLSLLAFASNLEAQSFDNHKKSLLRGEAASVGGKKGANQMFSLKMCNRPRHFGGPSGRIACHVYRFR